MSLTFTYTYVCTYSSAGGVYMIVNPHLHICHSLPVMNFRLAVTYLQFPV